MPQRTYAYLRLIPKRALQWPLAEQLLKDTIGGYGTFGIPAGALLHENDFGVAYSNTITANLEVESMTQYFRNGEIWGVNASISQHGEGQERWIPALTFENNFITSLELYCDYMRDRSKVHPPIAVEAGIVGVKNMRLTYDGLLKNMGKMSEPDVIHRATLPDFEKATRDAFLEAFFKKVHGNTGVQRPKGLFHRW